MNNKENFIKKLITILIVLFMTISLAQSNDQIAYLDLDNVVNSTKAGKLIASTAQEGLMRIWD